MTDLVLGVVLHDEDINDGKLVHVSVSLELLSHPRSNNRDGERNGVHGLDLGRLGSRVMSAPDHPVIGSRDIGQNARSGHLLQLVSFRTYSSNPVSVCRKHSSLCISPIGRSRSLISSVSEYFAETHTLGRLLGELGRCYRHCDCLSLSNWGVL